MNDEDDAPRARVTREGKRPPPGTQSVAGREPVHGKAPPLRRKEGDIRKRNFTGFQDRYDIPSHLIPSDTSLEWKTYTVMGQENRTYQAQMNDQGWRVAQAEDFPDIARRFGLETGGIIVDGMALMERPIELTIEARREDALAARSAVADKMDEMKGAPPGSTIFAEKTRVDRLRRSIGPVEIPEG